MKGLGAIFVTLAVFAANVAAAPSNNAPRYPHQPMEISAQVHKRVMYPRQAGNGTEEVPGAPSPILVPVDQQNNQPPQDAAQPPPPATS